MSVHYAEALGGQNLVAVDSGPFAPQDKQTGFSPQQTGTETCHHFHLSLSTFRVSQGFP